MATRTLTNDDLRNLAELLHDLRTFLLTLPPREAIHARRTLWEISGILSIDGRIQAAANKRRSAQEAKEQPDPEVWNFDGIDFDGES